MVVEAKKEGRFGGKAGEPFDKNYHQAGDTLANCNMDAWMANTRAIANSIAIYAMDLTGIPPRGPRVGVATPASTGADGKESHGFSGCHGSKNGHVHGGGGQLY